MTQPPKPICLARRLSSSTALPAIRKPEPVPVLPDMQDAGDTDHRGQRGPDHHAWARFFPSPLGGERLAQPERARYHDVHLVLRHCPHRVRQQQLPERLDHRALVHRHAQLGHPTGYRLVAHHRAPERGDIGESSPGQLQRLGRERLAYRADPVAEHAVPDVTRAIDADQVGHRLADPVPRLERGGAITGHEAAGGKELPAERIARRRWPCTSQRAAPPPRSASAGTGRRPSRA